MPEAMISRGSGDFDPLQPLGLSLKKKTIFESVWDMRSMLRSFSSLPLETVAKARSMAVFLVRSWIVEASSAGKFLRQLRTTSTSQMTQYLGFGGFCMFTPFIS